MKNKYMGVQLKDGVKYKLEKIAAEIRKSQGEIVGELIEKLYKKVFPNG